MMAVAAAVAAAVAVGAVIDAQAHQASRVLQHALLYLSMRFVDTLADHNLTVAQTASDS